MLQWTASGDRQRLDSFLAQEAEGLSRAQAQGLIKNGQVLVNDQLAAKPAQKLSEGDRVTIEGDVRVERRSILEPIDLSLEILYEDETCLVVSKPSGYAVHPGSGMPVGEHTILHGIAFLFDERSLPFSEGAILVHRLDKDTTGCLLVAKTSEAHASLQKQFEERSVQKIYLALVAGVPSSLEAKIDAPIGRNLTDRTRMSVMKTSVSREAQTTYRTVDSTDDCSLLECELHTGRTHQVRVHLSSIGHPLLGDTTYSSSVSRDLSNEYNVKRLCLHAWKLSFNSSVAGSVHVEAPIAQDFKEVLESVGMQIEGVGGRKSIK